MRSCAPRGDPRSVIQMAVSDSTATPAGRDEPVADWHTVPPVRGFWRPFDAFFGPGTSAREWVVLWLGVAVACAGTVALWIREDAAASFSVAALVWAFLASFDVYGGIMTLTTNSGKRWYNSPDQRDRRARLSFLSLHAVHLAMIAFLVLPAATEPLGFAPWVWFAVNLALLYVLGAVIELVALDIQRPVALVALLTAVMVNLVAVPLPLVLSFFAPLFFLKLFVGYLPIEAPWRTRPPAPPLTARDRA